MSLTKSALLQVLALVAGALSTQSSDRLKLAEANKQLEQYKSDHDLVNDNEVNAALSAVIEAAQAATPTAEAATAVAVTREFLDENKNGVDDRDEVTASEPDPAKVEDTENEKTSDESAIGDDKTEGETPRE